ncbi:MAG: response regulator [Actinomycetales bacterium]|nr:response regulator [Actinomycetales bacterium]
MRILVADDSKAMRMIVIRTLRQAGFSGHTIVEAENGRRALEMVDGDRPDLVLSDWNMPEMTGIELLKALRGRGDRIPFVFVTSESSPEMREMAEQSGATGLISKPFTPEAFQGALDEVMTP